MKATVIWNQDKPPRRDDQGTTLSFVPVIRLDDGGAPCAVSDYHIAVKVLNEWFSTHQREATPDV